MIVQNHDSRIYANGRTQAEHCAWLDSLTGDEFRISRMPIGHLFSIVLASVFKFHLLNTQMTADDRLKLLNGIASMIDGPVTAEAIAAIEPADAVGRDMMKVLCALGVSQQVMTFQKGDVFRLMALLNPSLLTALKLCQWSDEFKVRAGDYNT